MPQRSIDKARVLGDTLLRFERVDRVPPLRWLRKAALFANDLAGRPLCSEDELQRRAAGREAALAEVERAKTQAQPARRELAPVVVYVSDQDHRTPKKIGEVLSARDIPFVTNDVTDDEATRSWALTQARQSELPLVFIAGEPIGGLHELTQLDVSGELRKKVFGP